MSNHTSGIQLGDVAELVGGPVMRETSACDDCVVTVLCEREPNEAVLLDLSELQALRRLAQAGLAPGLRHTRG